MPIREGYHQGTPNWVDLQTTDQTAAKRFYADVFGWSFADQEMGEGMTYSMAEIDGKPVAAIAPQSQTMAEQGMPPVWNTYLAADDVDAVAAKVLAAGGIVALEPFDVPAAGRMAFVIDPAGAPFALWTAGGHIGAELVNEPGCFIWNELQTSEVAASAAFIRTVLGVETGDTDLDGQPYTVVNVDGSTVAGITAPRHPSTPSHWDVYFATADIDASAAKIAAAGGAVLGEISDSSIGRSLSARDPQGGLFGVYQPS